MSDHVSTHQIPDRSWTPTAEAGSAPPPVRDLTTRAHLRAVESAADQTLSTAAASDTIPELEQVALKLSSQHILIVVQNLPVPLDRRVWLECLALRAAGYEVSVICPKGPGDPGRQEIDGVHIYKYRPAPEAQGVGGFVIEFVYSWIRTALLSLAVARRQPFDVLQACNPPDTYWALARLWARRGVRFVFDQHDLNPELFLSRFGQPKSLSQRVQYGGLRWLEKMTYRSADRVISTNTSYRDIAIERGGLRPDHVTVVRSGPDTAAMRPIYPDADRVVDDRQVLAYLGIMGPQDGVDTVLQVMAELVHRRGRTDVRAVLMGFGDCYESLRTQCTELGLDDCVTFTGRVDRHRIASELSAAHIGVCPDLKTPLNDVSTMNKTMEYMAYALPSVAFDLKETRVSGADTALYVPSGDLAAFVDATELLLDDPELRTDLGLRARARVAAELDWAPQSVNYVSVMNHVTDRDTDRDADRHRSTDAGGRSAADHRQPDTDALGRPYVDLSDQAELRRFVTERTARPGMGSGAGPEELIPKKLIEKSKTCLSVIPPLPSRP